MLFKTRFMTIVSLAVALGATSVTVQAAAKPTATQTKQKSSKAKKNKLHPMCQAYLERRTNWYNATNNAEEYNQYKPLRDSYERMSLKEQAYDCKAAYDAFDDIDKRKFRTKK